VECGAAAECTVQYCTTTVLSPLIKCTVTVDQSAGVFFVWQLDRARLVLQDPLSHYHIYSIWGRVLYCTVGMQMRSVNRPLRGGRGRDKARRGCTRSHALTPSSRDTSTFFNSRTQTSERECVYVCVCAKVQYSKVSLGPHRKWPVAWSYPSPHCFSRLPQGNLTVLEIGGVKRCRHCHAAFHPKPRTKAEMFENTVASPTTRLTSINIRRPVKKYYYH
jgi:hypothetical protein